MDRLEKLKFQGNLLNIRKECEHLKVEIAKLRKNERITNEKLKTADEINAKVLEEQFEKDQIISQLMKKLSEKVQIIGTYEKKLKCFDEKEEQVKRKIQVLTGQILRDDQIIDEMKSEQSKANDEKNKVISELNEGIGKLKNQLLEKDQVVGMCKEQLKCLNAKVEQLQWENQDLKGQKLVADRNIYETKCAQSKADIRDKKIIVKLNEKIGKLKDRTLEKDQHVGECEKKLKCFHANLEHLERQIQGLKGQKVPADKMIGEMKYEQSKANDEKNKIISELNEKMSKLKNQLLEKDQTLGMYEEKLKCFDIKVEQAEREIQGLKDQKVAADQMIENMKCEQQEADQIIENKKGEQAKSNDTVEELRRRNLEASKIVEELRNQVLDAHATKEAEIVSDSKGEKRNSRIPITQGAGKNDVRVVRSTMTRVPSACNSTKRTSSGLQKTGSRKQEVESGKIAENQHQASLSENQYQAESSGVDRENECKRLKRAGSKIQGVASGENAENPHQARLPGYNPQAESSGVDQENECKRLKGTDSIDRSDEQNPVRSSNSSDSHENLGGEEKICETALSSSQMVSPNSFIQNRIPSILVSSDSDDLNSTDSDDESCSESCINNILANARCLKFCNRWVSVAEMRKDLEEDVELCMNAVCVLYRHKLSNPGVLGHFDEMRGSNLAEYLIDGDPQHRFKKFLSQVKRERPDDLALCWQLASDYCEKLFSIYHNGEDPMFKLM